jgi:hypothetical protein
MGENLRPYIQQASSTADNVFTTKHSGGEAECVLDALRQDRKQVPEANQKMWYMRKFQEQAKNTSGASVSPELPGVFLSIMLIQFYTRSNICFSCYVILVFSIS